MKIRLNSSQFKTAISSAMKVQNNKSTIAILDCVMLDVIDSGQALLITASDNDNTLEIRCPLVEYEPDADFEKTCFCVKSKMLYDALHLIPDQPITITVNMETMEIRGQYMNGSFQLIGNTAYEFPQVKKEEVTENRTFSMPAKSILAAINDTLYAAANDELRPVMNGVFFDIKTDKVTTVCSDGHILSRRIEMQTDGFTLPAEWVSFILPRKASAILKEQCVKNEDIISVAPGEKQVQFTTKNFYLTARLIEGNYPNYNAVIPTANNLSATVAREDIIPAIKRVTKFSDSSTELIKLSFESDAIVVSAQDYSFSHSAEERVPCTFSGNESFSIGVKGSLFADMLQHMPSDITIECSAPERPIVMHQTELKEGDADVLALLMPMMLN